MHTKFGFTTNKEDIQLHNGKRVKCQVQARKDAVNVVERRTFTALQHV